MLELKKLNQLYGQSHTLWDVELSVPEGQCVCLMGRNGVGKTTLLKAIMGLVPIASGEISFEGRDLARMPADRRAKTGIGYVPQGREIFANLTVAENLKVGSLSRPKGSAPQDERIFELFPVLRQMLNRRGGDLSGGQQQQLAIGRALAHRPKLLILDEPTEGIQPNIVHEIAELLIRLRNEGLTILLVEQKLAFARKVAQSFVILDRGRTVASGAMGTLDGELVERYLVV
ncbi:MAG: urea ABC transporter ATP-binding subunit UrtE [Polyangiaceae bacterium]